MKAKIGEMKMANEALETQLHKALEGHALEDELKAANEKAKVVPQVNQMQVQPMCISSAYLLT